MAFALPNISNPLLKQRFGSLTRQPKPPPFGVLTPQPPPPGSTDAPTMAPTQPGVPQQPQVPQAGIQPPSIQPPIPQPGSQPGTSFGPENNLIGQQLMPGVSPDTQTARGYIGQNLGSLQQLPDRAALAGQTYDQLAQQSAPQFAQDLQTVGRRAAALGRIGAGMTTSELGDVQSNREKYLGNLRAQLSTQAAGLAQQDQLGRLGASSGVYGQLGGQDQLDYQNLLGERGYQQGLSQQAFQNQLAAQGQGFEQQQAMNQLLGQYGFQGPNPLQFALAQQYGSQAQGSQQNAGDLLKILFANQQAGKTPIYKGGEPV